MRKLWKWIQQFRNGFLLRANGIARGSPFGCEWNDFDISFTDSLCAGRFGSGTYWRLIRFMQLSGKLPIALWFYCFRWRLAITHTFIGRKVPRTFAVDSIFSAENIGIWQWQRRVGAISTLTSWWLMRREFLFWFRFARGFSVLDIIWFLDVSTESTHLLTSKSRCFWRSFWTADAITITFFARMAFERFFFYRRR